jgi:cytoskeletal protein CcmA (bactofilin family)
MKKTNPMTFLGENTSFKGELSFHGTVRIDGRFKGQIHSDGTLIVGEKGIVEADINTNCAEISGEVHGNINTTQTTEIHPKGKVYGNIATSSLVIHDGVVFEGNCKMDQTVRHDLKQQPAAAHEKKRLIKLFPSLKSKSSDEPKSESANPEKEKPDDKDRNVGYS